MPFATARKKYLSGFSLHYKNTGYDVKALDWRDGHWVTAYSETPYLSWYFLEGIDFAMHEYGLERFHIIKWANEVPYEKFLNMAPAELLAFRREKEWKYGLEKVTVENDSQNHDSAKYYH